MEGRPGHPAALFLSARFQPRLLDHYRLRNLDPCTIDGRASSPDKGSWGLGVPLGCRGSDAPKAVADSVRRMLAHGLSRLG
jgi:hypothetical protein